MVLLYIFVLMGFMWSKEEEIVKLEEFYVNTREENKGIFFCILENNNSKQYENLLMKEGIEWIRANVRRKNMIRW